MLRGRTAKMVRDTHWKPLNTEVLESGQEGIGLLDRNMFYLSVSKLNG